MATESVRKVAEVKQRINIKTKISLAKLSWESIILIKKHFKMFHDI